MKNVSPWVWRSAGAAASVAILASVVIGTGAYSVLRIPTHSGSFNCLPSDFPTYANMTVAEADYAFGNPAPDDTISCQMVMDSYDKFSTVSTFYRKAFNTSGWSTVAVLEQPKFSIALTFQSKERPATHGWVTITNQGVSTRVATRLFS